MSQVEAPNSLRIWEFGGSVYYSKWPKVADAVIEAAKCIYGLLVMRHKGFDHGVGHSLLLLYDAKEPHGQKSM